MYMDGSDVIVGSPQESALQRLWSRRQTLTSGLDEPQLGLLDNLFPPAQDADTGPSKTITPTILHQPIQFFDIYDDYKPVDNPTSKTHRSGEQRVHLDAAQLGDLPARYDIPILGIHEYAVVGVWVDVRVVPGFRYRVRPIKNSVEQETPAHLFGGRALTLLSIGRGYAKRVTFEPDNNGLNDNKNYFWSDSRPEGFAFELEVVSVGDKFTLHDANHAAAGTVEVVGVCVPQEEIRQAVLEDRSIEKNVRIQVLAKVEWFEGNHPAAVMPVSGLAVTVKCRFSRAVVTKIIHVAVGSNHRRGFTLTPGGLSKWRRLTVSGETIRDVPTRYTITGLEDHELPVIGTYVDPRIIPGFDYKVRPAGNKRQLFGGRALRLVTVGPGYGKRMTFAPDSKQLNASENYLWSDTHPEGLGFEPWAVHAGMKFSVTSDGQKLGEASVFRADNAQREEAQAINKGPKGTTIVKHIHVDVTCHLTLASTNESREPEAQVMRVSGTAVMIREPGQSIAKLVRIESIGLDSQLNLLFVIQQAELVFYPL